MNIDFYREIEVVATAANQRYIGHKGVVMRSSEENDIIYGDAVFLHGEEQTVFLKKDDLIPTGIAFKKDDFY